MPTVTILGQTFERKHLLIGGGLIAAAVAVVVFLRARASASASAAQEPAQPAQDQSGAYGGGMSVTAPTGAVADQYQQQMDNASLQAQQIANDYQKNLVTQQQTQFEFQQKMQEQLAPELLKAEQANLAADTAYQTTLAKIPVACPPGYARARAPSGELVCNPKGSGSILTEPYKAVLGFERGVTSEAPEIGRRAAQAGESYLLNRYLPAPNKPKNQKSTPPIAAPQHGYEEHYT